MTTLTDGELRALICAAEASVARDPVQGWRDVAIVRVLADAGLRCEELQSVPRNASARQWWPDIHEFCSLESRSDDAPAPVIASGANR